MKKLLALILALLLTLTALVACDWGKEPSDDFIPPIGGNDDNDSTLPPANNDNSGADIDWDLI